MLSNGEALGVSERWLPSRLEVLDADGLSGPCASIGLLSGDTALELKGDDVDTVDGDELRPFPFLRMVAIVSEMVWRAACLALSVDTKLLTRSLRLPLTSGEASSSSGSDWRCESLEGSVADLDMAPDAPLDKALTGEGESAAAACCCW